jgi:hypothetical protein
MIRLSDSEKADLRSIAVAPEKQGVAITHGQLKALLIAQDERDELVEKMIEDEMVREDDAGYLSWTESGDLVAPGWG